MNKSSVIPVAESSIVTALSNRYLKFSAQPQAMNEWKSLALNFKVVVSTFYSILLSSVGEYWKQSGTAYFEDAIHSRFLDLVHLLMKVSQYEVLTEDLFALSEIGGRFPVACKWECLDDFLLPKWHEKKKLYKNNPLFSRHLLVYTRGMYTLSTDGYYFDQKIDYLLKYFWTRIFRRISPAVQSKHVEHLSQRYTLEDFFADRPIWKAFFQKVSLQEPCFNQVILLYRPKGSAHSATAFQLQEFSDVTLNDLRLAIFPFKTVHLPPLDSVKFVAQVAICVLCIQFSFEEEHEINDGAFWMLGLLIIGLVFRLISLIWGYVTTVLYYERQVETVLEKFREGRNAAVLSKLYLTVCDQELKEMLFAYFFLWRFGATTKDQLDKKVETFLWQEFATDIDFDVDDSLQKLVHLGLVGLTGDKFEIRLTPEQWSNLHPVEHLLSASLR